MSCCCIIVILPSTKCYFPQRIILSLVNNHTITLTWYIAAIDTSILLMSAALNAKAMSWLWSRAVFELLIVGRTVHSSQPYYTVTHAIEGAVGNKQNRNQYIKVCHAEIQNEWTKTLVSLKRDFTHSLHTAVARIILSFHYKPLLSRIKCLFNESSRYQNQKNAGNLPHSRSIAMIKRVVYNRDQNR